MVRTLALLVIFASAASDAFVMIAPTLRHHHSSSTNKKIQEWGGPIAMRMTTPINNDNTVLHRGQPAKAAVLVKVATAVTGSCLWKRMDTISAAGLLCDDDNTQMDSNDDAILRKEKVAVLRSIGYFGKFGIYIVSAMVVVALKNTIFPPTSATDGEQQPAAAGIMNRCPWPFIFFHDPKQGLKDSPTWIAVAWFALWRAFRMMAAK
mmetsp:Transcript_21016/g.34743  ORF Transcript_21016/g.34743 Transcript_21016/m.34743 type:complete len:207 (+) Transcript_21016:82-702(+)